MEISRERFMFCLMWREVKIHSQFGHLAIAVSSRLEVQIGGHASLNGCNFQRKRPVPPAPPCVHRLPCGLMIMIYNAGNLHKQWPCNDMVFGLQYDFLNHNDVLIIGTYFFLGKAQEKLPQIPKWDKNKTKRCLNFECLYHISIDLD